MPEEPPASAVDEAVRRLLAPVGPAGLPVPAYSGRSLPNITRSAVDATGAEVGDDPPLSPPLEAGLDPFAGRRAEGPVVIFLVDGFGWFPFHAWASPGNGPLAERWARLAHPITTIFPTTTTSALTSLSTATPPGRNGVVGYRQFLPSFGVVADLLKMTPVGIAPPDSLIGPEWTPSIISGAPTVFRRGVKGTALSRDKFKGSGFTRLLYDGATYVSYVTASDLAHQLTSLLGRTDPPSLLFAYWDELDTVHHVRGPHGSLFEFEAERLALLVRHVARGLEPSRARQTTLLVTGDHGLVPTDGAAQLRVDRVPEIVREMGRPLAGDRRAGYFAAQPGRAPALRAALEERLPKGSRVVAVEEAVRAGLFGPPPHHPEILARIGDLIAFVPAPHGLTYFPPGAVPPSRDLLGAHGGLAPEELIVPLVAGSLSEFLG